MSDKIIDAAQYLPEDAAAAAEKVASQTVQQLNFFAHLLKIRKCGQTEVDTHMSLLRNSFDDLAQILGKDVLSSRLAETQLLLREANGKISDLERKLGAEADTDTAMAKLRSLEERFETWYQLSGFHYATLTYYRNGINADFSDEIEHNRDTGPHIHLGDKALAVQIAPVVPYLFESGYDILKDNFHDNLLDTDKNKQALKDLFLTTFPGSHINGYKSHRNNDNFALRVEVYIPYKSIDIWYKNVVQKAAELGSYPVGKLYVRKTELESMLNSKSYLTYVPEPEQLNMRRELEQILSITTLWGEYLTMSDNRTAPLCSQWDVSYIKDGATISFSFAAGTECQPVENWFEKTFDIDIASDLMGNGAGA